MGFSSGVLRLSRRCEILAAPLILCAKDQTRRVQKPLTPSKGEGRKGERVAGAVAGRSAGVVARIRRFHRTRQGRHRRRTRARRSSVSDARRGHAVFSREFDTGTAPSSKAGHEFHELTRIDSNRYEVRDNSCNSCLKSRAYRR